MKVYSVKDCSDLLELNEQTARRYIDDFKLGSREKGANGVERRILNEKEFNRLSEIVELKEKGFTPKTIQLILSADLAVVSKDRLLKIEENVNKTFEEYGKSYIEMQNRIKSLERVNQKAIELKESAKEEKDDEIEELKKKMEKLESQLQAKEKVKNEPSGSKKKFWQKFFG